MKNYSMGMPSIREMQNEKKKWYLLHSPYFAILWAIVGIFTLWIGIKDFIHHNKCKH